MISKRGMCLLEVILASGILSAIALASMQSISQQMECASLLRHKQEASLILNQNRYFCENNNVRGSQQSGHFLDGTEFKLIKQVYYYPPLLEKALVTIKWEQTGRVLQMQDKITKVNEK